MGLGPLPLIALAFGVLAWASKASGSTSSSSSPSPSSGAAAFRAALLERARYDLGGRVLESGPIVGQYLAGVGLEPGAPWGGAAVWTWLRDAAIATSNGPLVLTTLPATGSPLALGEAAKRAGLWVPVSAVRGGGELPEPGSVAIWSYPRAAVVDDWWIYTMGQRDGGATRDERWFYTLEGDSGTAGDRVTRMERALDDPGLLGFVVFR